MGNNNEQFNIKQALIDSAQSYFSLLKNEVIIRSNRFVNSSEYKLRFFETNFLHLTGLKTTLTPKEFYDRCYTGTILESDYSLGLNNDRKTVKRKLKNLVNIGLFFKQEIMVQETFIKNQIVCRIATSDGKCTIGFVDAKYYLRPKTILANNHLDQKQPIYNVVPIIKIYNK